MKILEVEDKHYPKRLLKIKNPPKKLYVEGNETLLNNKSLAIVGSRNCSEYGIKYAKQFAEEISKKNITIISGLAVGIDAIAHDIAKNHKGNTIAVLGCGLNHMYPEENRELFKQILEKNGCIISEYEPDEKVDMKNFPQRNRIISGIANAVLVIEAEYRSGSIITGRFGLEQEKKVFCLPRDIGVSKGVGTNELIQKGAKLVTSPQEILQEFGIETVENEQTIEPKETIPQIAPEYQKIYSHITYTPQNIQYIAKQSGLKIAEVTQKLIMLELQGYIKSMPGNFYVRI